MERPDELGLLGNVFYNMTQTEIFNTTSIQIENSFVLNSKRNRPSLLQQSIDHWIQLQMINMQLHYPFIVVLSIFQFFLYFNKSNVSLLILDYKTLCYLNTLYQNIEMSIIYSYYSQVCCFCYSPSPTANELA